jgi:hypothetical protein
MKKLYAICLLTLAVVLVDIVFFHSGKVSAQTTQTTPVYLQYVKMGPRGNLDGSVTPVIGNIVGFACAGSDYTSCYIASTR